MKGKTKKQLTTPSNLFCYLPPEDHLQFKLAAAKEGKPMSVILRQLVKQWVKSHNSRQEEATA